MTGLLLDTHAWLWWLLGSAKLGRQARANLESSRDKLWLSPISVWEIGILTESGRLKFDRPYRAWVEAGIAMTGVKTALLSHEVAIRSIEVRLPHRDPADRLLAATAVTLELRLVTADERLREADWLPTLDATA